MVRANRLSSSSPEAAVSSGGSLAGFLEGCDQRVGPSWPGQLPPVRAQGSAPQPACHVQGTPGKAGQRVWEVGVRRAGGDSVQRGRADSL